jgi:hypothetical protein
MPGATGIHRAISLITLGRLLAISLTVYCYWKWIVRHFDLLVGRPTRRSSTWPPWRRRNAVSITSSAKLELSKTAALVQRSGEKLSRDSG